MTHEHLDSTTTFTISIEGETWPYGFTKADFTEPPYNLEKDDLLNTVGVVCPNDRNEPIMIATEASETYAQWATVHEQMCQRGDGSKSCDKVEATVLDLMRQNGVAESDILTFVRERIQMFDRLIKMYSGDSDDAKQKRETFALTKEALESALSGIKE